MSPPLMLEMLDRRRSLCISTTIIVQPLQFGVGVHNIVFLSFASSTPSPTSKVVERFLDHKNSVPYRFGTQSLFHNCSFFTNVTFACIWPIWRRTSSLPVFACWFCGQRCQHSTSCSASVSFSPNSVSSFRNKLNNPLRQDRICRQELVIYFLAAAEQSS